MNRKRIKPGITRKGVKAVLAPWPSCWRMMREKNDPKVHDGEGEEAEEESARHHGRDGLRTQTQRAYAGGDVDAKE